MRNRNGFSLVELLVVIVIIAILLALLVPGYITMYNQVKRSSYNSKIKQIESNALQYGNHIKDEVKNLTCMDIYVNDLITKGYMASEEEGRNVIKNPTNGADLNGIIRLCYCDNKYDINANYAEDYNPSSYYHKGEKVLYDKYIYECVADAPPDSIGSNYQTTTTAAPLTSTRLGETTWPQTSLQTAYPIPDKYFKKVTCE